MSIVKQVEPLQPGFAGLEAEGHLKKVGAARFELATPCSQSRCAKPDCATPRDEYHASRSMTKPHPKSPAPAPSELSRYSGIY